MIPNLKKYLSEKETSERIGIAVSTLRNHRHQRKGLPYIKHGRRVLYDAIDIDNYMEARKISFEDLL